MLVSFFQSEVKVSSQHAAAFYGLVAFLVYLFVSIMISNQKQEKEIKKYRLIIGKSTDDSIDAHAMHAIRTGGNNFRFLSWEQSYHDALFLSKHRIIKRVPWFRIPQTTISSQ